MRKFGICAAFAVLGFVIGYGLYMTLGIFLLDYLGHQTGGSAESNLGFAFMVVLPVCLMVGSLFSGYFCQPYIRKSYLFVLLSPGLYVSIAAISTAGGTIDGFLEFMLLCSSVITSSSIVGVYVGKYLRVRRLVILDKR